MALRHLNCENLFRQENEFSRDQVPTPGMYRVC